MRERRARDTGLERHMLPITGGVRVECIVRKLHC